MAALSIGDVVVMTLGRQEFIGEIVGVRAYGDDFLYDVSCQYEVLKARLAEELRRAEPADIEAVLTKHSIKLDRIRSASHGTPKHARDELLHQEFLQSLTVALANLRENAKASHVIEGGHRIGDRLVVRRDKTLLLGTVRSRLQRNGGLVYQVEVEGEIESHPDGELERLEDVDFSGLPFRLGERCRLLAEGHEDDPDFEATVCRIERLDGKPSFSIAFDDGDVFEGLGAKNLLPLD